VILFAHAGHILLDLLYAGPLLVMIGLLVIGKLRERRNRDLGLDRPRGGTDAAG
jgi:hypothetical protein